MESALAVTSAGDAGDRVLVLIHAFPLDHRLWRHTLDRPPAGTRVVAIDMPGFGATPLDILGPERRYDFDLIAELIATAVRSRGIEKAVFGGCSMGGFTCFAVLRRHPKLIAGLILADTRAVGDTAAAREGRRQLISMTESGGIEAVADAMALRLLGPTTHAGRPGVVGEVRSIILEQPTDTIVTALRGMAERPDSTPLLGSIDVPASVVVGAEDPTVTVEDAALMANAIPGCELDVIEGAGHLPPLEDPEAFEAITARVLDRAYQ